MKWVRDMDGTIEIYVRILIIQPLGCLDICFDRHLYIKPNIVGTEGAKCMLTICKNLHGLNPASRGWVQPSAENPVETSMARSVLRFPLYPDTDDHRILYM